MSLEPLAIKYRPKKMLDVVGQDVNIKILTNSFKSKDWHHAYLLNGSLGSGKTTLARIMAAMENCKEGRNLEPCGKCDHCKAIFAGKFVDVRELNAASNRGIDEMRLIIEEAQFSPVSGRVKYYILDEAHSLSSHAAESCIKFIEEPPKNVRIILCTTEPHLLKPTLQSRCINLNFNKLGWLDVFNNLEKIVKQEGVKITEDALRLISKHSKGSARNSLQYLQSIIGSVQKVLSAISVDSYFNLVDSIIDARISNAVIQINNIINTGKNVDNILDGLTEHLRNLLLVKSCKDDKGIFDFSEDEMVKYQNQAEKIKPISVVNFLNLLIDVQKAVEVNLNVQHYLEKFVVEAIVEHLKNSKN